MIEFEVESEASRSFDTTGGPVDEEEDQDQETGKAVFGFRFTHGNKNANDIDTFFDIEWPSSPNESPSQAHQPSPPQHSPNNSLIITTNDDTSFVSASVSPTCAWNHTSRTSSRSSTGSARMMRARAGPEVPMSLRVREVRPCGSDGELSDSDSDSERCDERVRKESKEEGRGPV